MGAENKRFTVGGNRIKREGKLLNINFETKTDAKLCCKLCNQMDKEKQEFVDKVDEIHRWYKEYYGETILDTKMGWNADSKISNLKKKNEQLKEVLKKQLDDYTEKALLLNQPYGDVTEVIQNIADELGVDLCMTEKNKRFSMDDPNDWGFPITDNVTGKVYSCASNILMKELCVVVNTIFAENEKLKKENYELHRRLGDFEPFERQYK